MSLDSRRHAPGWFLRFAAAVAIVLLAGGVVLSELDRCPAPILCGPLIDNDIIQTRLDTALPAPQGGFAAAQTFTPRRNGLTEIELLLVRYGNDPSPAENERFLLRLRDESGQIVAEETLPTAGLRHNQPYVLRFPAQPRSAGRQYTLELTGSGGNPIAAWGYSQDVLDAGQLELRGAAPETAAHELRFVARYRLSAWEAVRQSAGTFADAGGLLLATLLFLPLPGVLILLLARPRRWDVAAWWGTAFALGAAVWPLVWFWSTLLRGRWAGWSLWLVVIAGWAVAVLIRLRRRNRQAETPGRLISSTGLKPAHWLLLLLLLISPGVRLLAVRDLAFPPWVDSSRHALITALIAEQGRVPAGYEPYLPIDRFPYHFGFHTISGSLTLLTGRPLPALLLYLGQLLNALTPLTVYAGTWLAVRRRGAALLAAFLVALPFFFPAYYATWGRMTQLTAVFVMPVLLALTWRLGRGGSRVWPVVGLLAAGLFLIHFRVFLFYAPYAVLVGLVNLATRRPLRPLLGAGLLALALVAPRLLQLLTGVDPIRTLQSTQPGYNAFPIGYYNAGWDRYFIWLALAALPFVLWAVWRRQRWASFPLLLVVWVAALFLLLAGERLGLPETLVVNLNSMYITLFVPLSLYLGIVVDRGARYLTLAGRPLMKRAGRPVAALAAALAAVVAGLLIATLALFGARQQIGILNPDTILARTEDEPALAWAAANLPADALVAVNSWQWSGSTWAGTDGGAWLLPLSGRLTTTPPIDHIYSPELFAETLAFNEAATAVKDWSEPEAADWLRSQGVTHVFVGARGGFFDPAALSRNPELELLYRGNGVFVFALGD